MVWQPTVPMLAAAALAVVAVGLGYAGRVLVEPTSAVVASNDAAPSNVELVPASADANGVRRVSMQFVLDAPEATSVSLVGDFNGWDPAVAVMKDPTGSGVWEVTLLLPPGRHTYAFLVSDSIWTPDPRAPQVADPDYGRSNSVVLVPDR